MKPSGERSSFISRGLDLRCKRIETPSVTAPTKPMATLVPNAPALVGQDPWPKESLRQRTLKRAVATIRSKSKTRRLVELCAEVVHRVPKSDTWFAKYEAFFRSPVWKLVSDEAIRKAHFKCEYWGCTGHAIQVHLLEFPEEHLDPNFDWMKRDNILIALCRHHHDMMHGFVMKRVVPSDRPAVPAALPSVLATSAPRPGAAVPKSTCCGR